MGARRMSAINADATYSSSLPISPINFLER
jgi:hypothetical protein